MKKILCMLLAIVIVVHAFSQTTITRLPAAKIKEHFVYPVKIEGSGDFFFFEGFAGRKPGCFGIEPNSINTSTCDRFVFEFAGNLAGTTIPRYYIKRTDGKYLSFQLGGAAYVDKFTDKNLRFQQWVVTEILNHSNPAYTNGYAFILPLAPVTYGYVLKVFNNFTAVGFSDEAKIDPAQSEFYMAKTPKHKAEPASQLLKANNEQFTHEFEATNGQPIDLTKLGNADHSFTGKDGSRLLLSVINNKVVKTRLFARSGKEITVLPDEGAAAKTRFCMSCRFENDGTRTRTRVCVIIECKEEEILNNIMKDTGGSKTN